MSVSVKQYDAERVGMKLATDEAALVIGSPPYARKGERYIGSRRKWDMHSWAQWMVRVTRECLRVCRGPVLWVVNSPSHQRRYEPAVERLIVGLDDAGVPMEPPCIWHKNPGGRRRDYFTDAWEYVVCAKHPGPVPTYNWQEIAQPPKYKTGGRYRQRDAKGVRRTGGEYPQNKLVLPTNVFYVTVGGGHMGSPLAHETEAPFPERIVEPFIRVLTNPGDLVCDPFVGSGTTGAVCKRLARNFIGFDIRESQVELARRRIAATSERPPPLE